MLYTIIGYEFISRYAPAPWYRRLFGPRERVVLTAPGSTLLCHPETIPSLTKFLDSKGLRYQISRPQLQVLQGGKA